MTARHRRTRSLTISLGLLLTFLLVGLPALPNAQAMHRRHLIGRAGAAGATPAQITLSPSSVLSGGAVTVSGDHFWAGEPVHVGIGLTALVTVTAAAGGVLPPTRITIPIGAFAGTHTVFALGGYSLRLATAPLLVLNAAIHIQPTGVPPGGTVTVSGDSFGPTEEVRVGIDGQTLVNAASTADGTLPTTEITIPFSASPGPHAIFAQGVNSMRTVTTTVQVEALQPNIGLNASSYEPGREACVFGSGYGPNETLNIAVNGNIAATGRASASGNVSLCFAMPGTIVSGDNVVSATGVQTGARAIAHFTGLPPISTTFYFAGGSTNGGDTTDLPLLNSGALRARVVLTFYTRRQGISHTTVAVAAHTYVLVHLGDYIAPGNAIGLRVESDQRIAAQMIVHRTAKAPYSTPPASALSTTWYLAEGYTGQTFHELLYLLNPQSHDVTIQVQAIATGKEKPRMLSYTISAGRVATLEMNRLYPRHTIGAIVRASAAILVTRLLTFGPHGYGANANNGVPSLQNAWVLANGSVVNGTQTYISVLNPSTFQKASVTINMYDNSGQAVFLHTERVLPLQRTSIGLNSLLVGSGAGDFDIVVSSTVPLAVERTMYYGNPNRERVASSVVTGAATAAPAWSFASGDTTNGQHEYLTAYNPNQTAITVHATFYVGSGNTVTADIPLQPLARRTVDASAAAAALPQSLHGVSLTSSNIFAPFVAEQGIYSSDYTAGYSSVGLPQ